MKFSTWSVHIDLIVIGKKKDVEFRNPNELANWKKTFVDLGNWNLLIGQYLMTRALIHIVESIWIGLVWKIVWPKHIDFVINVISNDLWRMFSSVVQITWLDEKSIVIEVK